jgi:hypothetical protein
VIADRVQPGVNGESVGFEANTTPWETMSEAKFAHKMALAAADFALVSEGKLDRVICDSCLPGVGA